jgi:cysteine desulfurase/selenocysteine lyase
VITTERQLELAAVRHDFPILDQEVNGRRMVYLDSAASAQKPRSVIDAVAGFYLTDNANVHRGLYELSRRATDRFEAARATLAQFLGARRHRGNQPGGCQLGCGQPGGG